MTKAQNSLQEYLREGLLALVPVYRDETASTRIYTRSGQHEDPRSVNWILRTIATYYWMELSELRRYYSRFLGLRHNISIPLDASLVLLPLKTRAAASLGEVTVGYMNLPQIQDILPVAKRSPEKDGNATTPVGDSPQEALSVVLFKNGFMLQSLNTPETMEERLRQGHQVRREFLRRKQGAAPYMGITVQDILEILPPCECILKEYFLRKFDRKE